MIKLKECPFCGKEIKHYNVGYTGDIATKLEATCNYCCAEIRIEPPIFYTENEDAIVSYDDAIAIWNRRANESNVND